jgi:hypothetical protein
MRVALGHSACTPSSRRVLSGPHPWGSGAPTLHRLVDKSQEEWGFMTSIAGHGCWAKSAIRLRLCLRVFSQACPGRQPKGPGAWRTRRRDYS